MVHGIAVKPCYDAPDTVLGRQVKELEAKVKELTAANERLRASENTLENNSEVGTEIVDDSSDSVNGDSVNGDEEERPNKRRRVETDFHDRVLFFPSGVGDGAPVKLFAQKEDSLETRNFQYFLFNDKGELALPCSTSLHSETCKHKHGIFCHALPPDQEEDWRRASIPPPNMPHRKRPAGNGGGGGGGDGGGNRRKTSACRKPIFQPFLFVDEEDEPSLWLATGWWKDRDEYVVQPFVDIPKLKLGNKSRWTPYSWFADDRMLVQLKRESQWDHFSSILLRNKALILSRWSDYKAAGATVLPNSELAPNVRNDVVEEVIQAGSILQSMAC